jgi:hypothetical protein
MDMRFGTWNVRSPCREGSLTVVARERAKYKLDLVGTQIRWDRGGTEPAGYYTFSMEMEVRIMMGSDRPGPGICLVLAVGVELILHNWL